MAYQTDLGRGEMAEFVEPVRPAVEGVLCFFVEVEEMFHLDLLQALQLHLGEVVRQFRHRVARNKRLGLQKFLTVLASCSEYLFLKVEKI